VHSFVTSIMKRLATTVALMLFVGTLPAAMLCCIDQQACTTMVMQAPMPCCAGSCTMAKPDRAHDNEATLTAAPALKIGAGLAVGVVAQAIPGKVWIAIASNDRHADRFFPPPPILLNEQFRI
jgi:hypothetical protein